MVYSSIVLFSILVSHVLYWAKLDLVSIRGFSTSNTSARQRIRRLETLCENRLNLDFIDQNTFYLIKWYEQTKNWNKICRTKYRRKLLHILLSRNMQKFYLMILIRLSLKNPFLSSLSSINLAKQ